MSTKAKTGLAFQNGQVNYVDGITSADLTAIVGGTGKDFSLYGLTEPGNIKASDDKTVSLKTLLTYLASQGGGGTGGGTPFDFSASHTFTGANTFNTGITTIQNLKITDNTINYGTNNTPLDLSTLGSSNVKLTPVAGTTATGNSAIKTVSISHNQGATFKTAPTFKTFVKLQASTNQTVVVPEGIYGVEVTDTDINIKITDSAIRTFCTNVMGFSVATSTTTTKINASTTMFSAVVFK